MARYISAFFAGLLAVSFLGTTLGATPSTSNSDLYLQVVSTSTSPTSTPTTKKLAKTPKAVKSSGFAATQPATGSEVFIFDPKLRKWAAYDSDGNLIKTGRASGGRNYCPDIHRACRTPVWQFQVYAKQGAGCKSKKFPVGRGGAPMPYCTFFHGGFAVHGSYEVRSYNASHGCIRVVPTDAHWLQNFLSYGSTVIVRPY